MGQITGQLTAGSSGSYLAGFKVVVVAEDAAGSPRAMVVCTFDAKGEARYTLAVPGVVAGQASSAPAAPVNIRIVDGSPGPPATGLFLVTVTAAARHSDSELNLCFDGTSPAWRVVSLPEETTVAAGVDFLVLWSLGFHSQPCWP